MPSPRSATSRGPNSTSASSGAILTRDTQRTGNTAEGDREDRFGTSTERTGTVSLFLLHSLFGAWIPPRDLSNPFDLLPRSVDADVRIPPSFLCSRKNRGARSRSRRLGSPQEPGRDGSATATRSRGHVPIRSRRERCRARSPDRSGNARRGEFSLCFWLVIGWGQSKRKPRLHTVFRYSIGRLLNHYAFSRIRVSGKKETTETSERTPRSLPLDSILIPLSHVVIIRGFSHTRRSASASECARPSDLTNVITLPSFAPFASRPRYQKRFAASCTP
jgi:hypothetical protein